MFKVILHVYTYNFNFRNKALLVTCYIKIISNYINYNTKKLDIWSCFVKFILYCTVVNLNIVSNAINVIIVAK
jgi:hypothetical protein